MPTLHHYCFSRLDDHFWQMGKGGQVTLKAGKFPQIETNQNYRVVALIDMCTKDDLNLSIQRIDKKKVGALRHRGLSSWFEMAE